MNPEETHVNFASDPMYLTLVFSINIRKIKFIAYSHIPFNQNLDKKLMYALKLNSKTITRSFLLTGNSVNA